VPALVGVRGPRCYLLLIDDHPFPNIGELVARNAHWAEGFDARGLAKEPTRRLAIVTCMDCRVDVESMLGLAIGEAHIIRNAGGAVTDDAIRSLCLSQRALGTREILVIHHTQCGLEGLDEHVFNAELEDDLGVRPPWALESFRDPYDDVRQSIRRLELSPYIAHKDHIAGFVYDVASGKLQPVD